jgi:hypothetical protein
VGAGGEGGEGEVNEVKSYPKLRSPVLYLNDTAMANVAELENETNEMTEGKPVDVV